MKRKTLKPQHEQLAHILARIARRIANDKDGEK